MLLKPGKIYKYLSKVVRPVYVQPNAYESLATVRLKSIVDPWRYPTVPKVTTLKQGDIIMPLESCLCAQDRWTKIFVNNEMGWFRIYPTDSPSATFKQLFDESSTTPP